MPLVMGRMKKGTGALLMSVLGQRNSRGKDAILPSRHTLYQESNDIQRHDTALGVVHIHSIP